MTGDTANDLITTPDGEPIMVVKLKPPDLPPWWVVRERLRDELGAGMARQLTLVTGPAGSGKSTLVADWVAIGRARAPVAWLSLEPADDQPGAFWSYVLAAIDQAGVSVPHRWHSAVDTADRSFLVRLAVDLGAWPEPIVLVLDNAHLLTQQSVLDGLHFLLEHAGTQLRTVLIGRTDPLLPLHRYRLTGSITEIRHDDLAFTPVEADALLTAHDARLGAAALATLIERTNGWAAALRLEARSRLTHDGDQASPELADYVRNELLNEQTAATRDLLLSSSVAEQLPAGLAVELTGRRDAAQVLDRLAREGVFVTVAAGNERAYVHHPQVRSVLLDALADGPADRVAGLHQRAAHWYAGFDRHAEALPHAVRAHEWELAARCVVRGVAIACFLVGPEADQYVEAFASMPADVDTAEAAVVQAAVAHHLGDSDACTKHLLRAAEMSGAPASSGEIALPLCLAAVDLARATWRGEPAERAVCAEIASQALEHALSSGVNVPIELTLLIRLAWADSLMRRHDLAGARRALQAAANECDVLCRPTQDGPVHAELFGRLALMEALSGRLRRAAEHARRSLELREPADPQPTATADVALAWVHADEHDMTAARTYAERAGAVLSARSDPVLYGLLALVRARIHRARGDVSRAAEVIAEAMTGPSQDLPPWLIEVLGLSRAALVKPGRFPATAGTTPQHAIAEAVAALAVGDTHRAHSTVAALADRSGLPLDVQVDGWLVRATAELMGGQRESARRALRKALALAEPERLRRPLLEASPLLRRFLREERDLGVRHDWLGVEPAVAAPPDPVTPMVVEPLTAKENEVLVYLAQLLSTEEIARTMFVSVNTVKTHVRGVLRKLAATRRNEAVRRARKLGML